MQITKNHFGLPPFLLISISIPGTGEVAAPAGFPYIPSMQRVRTADVFKYPGKAAFHQFFSHKQSLYTFYYQRCFMLFLCTQAQTSGVTGGPRTPARIYSIFFKIWKIESERNVFFHVTFPRNATKLLLGLILPAYLVGKFTFQRSQSPFLNRGHSDL